MATPEMQQVVLKCPVCTAGFRGTETCPRCGTSLQLLMKLAARAWALRQKARAKLREGDLAAALRYSAAAGETQQDRTAGFAEATIRHWDRAADL